MASAEENVENVIHRMCRDEYESYRVYKALAGDPMVSRRLRAVLTRAAEDEFKHYEFWRSIAGECSSGVSRFKVLLYKTILYLFGLTLTLKILESKEARASEAYKYIARHRPDLSKKVEEIFEDEERHENEFLSGIDEGRVRYIGSITLGISDALVELTGIYAGSLGAFESTVSAGLTGLLAGIAASISMGIASYSQAKHEGRQNPRLSAVYTSLAYIIVVILLAAPYFVVGSLYTAFAAMVSIAIGVIAYISFYAAVLHGRRYVREVAESTLLILGVSLLLYVLGSWLGQLLGIGPAD